MRVLKILCPECGHNAIIRKTNRKDPKLSDLYCQCQNVECSHSFVMNLTFDHTISPSALTNNRLVKYLAEHLPPADHQMVLDLLAGRAR